MQCEPVKRKKLGRKEYKKESTAGRYEEDGNLCAEVHILVECPNFPVLRLKIVGLKRLPCSDYKENILRKYGTTFHK